MNEKKREGGGGDESETWGLLPFGQAIIKE